MRFNRLKGISFRPRCVDVEKETLKPFLKGRKMKKKVAIFSLVLLVVGCAQRLKPGMMLVYSQPLVQVEKDPDEDFDKYKNFTVFPTAELDKDSKMNPIIEKQLLFLVRNNLELLGYNYVNTIEEADFYVGVYYSNEYKSVYVPPSSTTIPWYVPGQNQTTYMNLYGSGGWSSWGTATTTTPGYYVPMTYTTPGHYTGAYYPCISASAFDKGTKKVVWSGRATVSTPEKDMRLSGQWLLGHLLLGKENTNLPICSGSGERDDSNDGVFGIFPRVITLDGNNFYPIIIGLFCDSPAHKQGLRVYDTITHIDGKSTLNWPRSKTLEAMNKNKGEELVLTIKRGDKVFDVYLLAEDEAVARANWKKIKWFNEKGNIITMKRPTQP